MKNLFSTTINGFTRHLLTLLIGIYYIFLVFNSITLVLGDDPIIKGIPFNSVGGGLLISLAIISFCNVFFFFKPICKTILPDDEVWFRFKLVREGKRY